MCVCQGSLDGLLKCQCSSMTPKVNESIITLSGLLFLCLWVNFGKVFTHALVDFYCICGSSLSYATILEFIVVQHSICENVLIPDGHNYYIVTSAKRELLLVLIDK